MCLMNTRARAATPLALAGLVTLPLALAACGYQPSLGDYRPVVDSYNTDMAAYEADSGQCVAVAMQAQAEYCLLYTSPSPRDRTRSRMPSSA